MTLRKILVLLIMDIVLILVVPITVYAEQCITVSITFFVLIRSSWKFFLSKWSRKFFSPNRYPYLFYGEKIGECRKCFSITFLL